VDFEVLDAGDGLQALEFLSQQRPVDVVLTDLAMPELGGRELAQQLSRMRSGLPVIFKSGYADDYLTRRGLLEAGAPFLEKLFSPWLWCEWFRTSSTRFRRRGRLSAPGATQSNRPASALPSVSSSFIG